MRHRPLNWIQWLTLILLLAMSVTTPWLFYRVRSVQHHQNDALRSIMCRAETVVRRAPVSATFTVKQKRQALRFYTQALAAAHLLPCDQGD